MIRRWEQIAQRRGGTVTALAIASSADRARLVFAGTPIGVRRSSDGGRTWTVVGRGNLAAFVEAVAPSPDFARDRTCFLGTPGGLYGSIDGGETWHLRLSGGHVLALAVSPSYARDQVLLAGTANDGALRSDDGGASWASANPGLLDLTVLSIALSPEFERDRTGFAATSSGLYRTRNGGRSWRAIDLALDEPEVQCLAVSPDFANDGLAFAGTAAEGLLRSDDGGNTWELVRMLAGRPVTAVAFSAHYLSSRVIAAATAEGIALSHDGGESWRLVAGELGPVLSLAFTPHGDGEALLAGLPRRGVARFDPAGRAWTLHDEGLCANLLVALALSPAFARDRTMFSAGLEDGAAVSTDGGVTWIAANAGLDDTAVVSLAVSPHYRHDRALYAATASGLYRSRDGAATWLPAEGATLRAAARTVTTGVRSDDEPWPVVASLEDGRLLVSDDGGQTWWPLTWGFGEAEVVSLAVSPGYAEDRTIFACTTGTAPPEARQFVTGLTETDVALWRSTDGGRSWTRWLVARGPNVLPLAVAPSYPLDETVFVGVGGRVMRPLRRAREIALGERRPIWRSAELPGRPSSITALATSPNYRADTTLFAASSAGVCVSRDGATTFTAWSEGLDPPAVVALATSPDYPRDRLVYASGLGGTIWRRRDD